MLKKKVFFPVLALAIIGTALATSNLASAQDTTGVNSLVSAIAQKFNLNESEVQAVFDEEHQKRETEMKARIEQKLTQAVTDGKITEAQKQAIITHFTEMKNNRPNPEEFKDLTDEQIQAKMEAKKTEMDAWLSQNGLTHEKLREVMGGPMRIGIRGGGKGMMFFAH